MCRLWNRFLGVSDSRLRKKLSTWDMLMGGPWAEHTHMIFQRTGFEEAYILKEKVDLDVIKDAAFQHLKEKWAVALLFDKLQEHSITL